MCEMGAKALEVAVECVWFFLAGGLLPPDIGEQLQLESHVGVARRSSASSCCSSGVASPDNLRLAKNQNLSSIWA